MDIPARQLAIGWQEILKDELQKPYMQELAQFVRQERLSGVPVYPSQANIFNAFNLTPYEEVKVVIVGQDPYHGPGQAHGLCFSVPHGVPPPPSLINIYKELQSDLGIPRPNNGCLESWAKQGVFLLNAALTVRHGKAQSHYSKGWEQFTDAVIQKLCERQEPIVFLLWGRFARNKCAHIAPHHFILQAPHPSPLSAHNGFFGCKHFSKTKQILTSLNKPTINW